MNQPHTAAARPLLRRALTVLIAGIVVTATLALTALALLPVVDARAMAVTSGSMEPGIGVGSLLVVRTVDPDTIRPGDVITYAGYTAQNLTTHRVLQRRQVSGALHFQTQGDANDSPDVDLAPASGVVGQAVLDVPHAGRALAALTQPTVRLLVLGLPALWMIVTQTRALRRALHARRGRHQRPAATTVPRTLILVLLFALTLTLGSRALPGTGAVLSDTTVIADNAFATGTW